MTGFSEKQLKVLNFPYTDYEAIICDGSVRSGKSISMDVSYITSTMAKYNNQNFALCSKTVKTAERNIIKVIMSIRYFHQEFSITYKKTESMLVVTRGNKKNCYYIFGGKDESSYQLIQGITLAGALFDEVALMPESFVNQATARCSVKGSQLWFNCNPEDPNNWFYREWIKKADERKALYIHFTMQDNPSLDEKTIDRYERMYDGVFYQRYIKGLWVKAEGLIYKKFANNPELFIRDTLPKDITLIQAGVDFGGTGSGTTFVARAFTKGFETTGIIESVRYVDKKMKNKTPYDIVEELTPQRLDELWVEFGMMLYEKYKKPFVTRADSAEQVLIRGMKNASYKARLHTDIKNAKKTEINERIKLTTRLQAQGRWWVMSHCKTAIEAYKNAVWDTKHPDTRLDDGTTDIDTIDADEYSIEEFTKILIDSGGKE